MENIMSKRLTLVNRPVGLVALSTSYDRMHLHVGEDWNNSV